MSIFLRDITIDNMLTLEDERSDDPGFSILLCPHQLAAIQRMIHLEETKSFEYRIDTSSTIRCKSNTGFFTEQPGMGKTLTMLGLIETTKDIDAMTIVRMTHASRMTSLEYQIEHTVSSSRFKHVSIIVAPSPAIEYSWKADLAKTSLRALEYSTLNTLTEEDIDSVDVILCHFSDLVTFTRLHIYVWQRVIYDNITSMHKHQYRSMHCGHTWFIDHHLKESMLHGHLGGFDAFIDYPIELLYIFEVRADDALRSLSSPPIPLNERIVIETQSASALLEGVFVTVPPIRDWDSRYLESVVRELFRSSTLIDTPLSSVLAERAERFISNWRSMESNTCKLCDEEYEHIAYMNCCHRICCYRCAIEMQALTLPQSCVYCREHIKDFITLDDSNTLNKTFNNLTYRVDIRRPRRFRSIYRSINAIKERFNADKSIIVTHSPEEIYNTVKQYTTKVRYLIAGRRTRVLQRDDTMYIIPRLTFDPYGYNLSYIDLIISFYPPRRLVNLLILRSHILGRTDPLQIINLRFD